VLKNNGITGSMGRVGACGDNAAMESFFALLQKYVLDRQRWSTREELRLAIVVWIERTYHRKGQVQMRGVTRLPRDSWILGAEGAEFGCLFLLVGRDEGEA
jgi:hypothetical protein